MEMTVEKTVGQLVAENPARARVFEKHRIDFCCGGKMPLSEACAKRGLSLDVVAADLAHCDTAGKPETRDWTTAPLSELADHIVATHHAYLQSELPRLAAMASRVAKVHGEHAPQTITLHAAFTDFREELEEHAQKEEQILFPWIRGMESGSRSGVLPTSVANPIRCMEQEHDNAGKALELFRNLTNNYTPPMDACNTWRVLYASLEALEEDMHVHVHKENSILFPRAVELEQSLADGTGGRV